MEWLLFTGVLAASYLIGAIPSGLVVGALAGRSPLEHGSGKTGTANTLHTAGPGAAAVVLVLDFVKGVLVVLLARLITWPNEGWRDLAVGCAAAAAIIGHNWSVWVRLFAKKWGGGRGIVTALGAMLMVNPIVVLAAALVGGLLMLITRYMAVGAIAGALAAVVAVLALGAAGSISLWLLPGAAAWGLLVIVGFHDNIDRLLSGTETRLGVPREPV